MSAINDLNLYIDIKNRRLVRDIFSDVETVVPKLTQGDGYNLRVHGVQAAPGRPVGRVYDFVPLPDALFVGVGKVGDIELTGTFTLTYDGDTTSAISVNATAAQIQAALNSLSTQNADWAVTGPDGGPWQVSFFDNGDGEFITANVDSVFPFSSFRAYVLREGSASINRILLLVIDPQLATLAETFTNLPAAAGDVTKLQSGASGVPDIQRVSISRDAYDGGFTLSFDGETTQFIPQDADAEEVKQALDALSNIGADGVTVTGAKPNWDVSFTGLAGNQNTMTIDVGGLVVPIGKQGILNLATGGIELLVSNQSSAEAKLEVTGIVDGNHGTILQADCTILNDGIQNDPVAGPTTPTLATQAEVTALEGRVDDVEDALDALDNGVVRFDVAQSLDPSEKTQASNNIGVLDRAVSYISAQSLTEGQQDQARENIDAAKTIHTHTVTALPIATQAEAEAATSSTVLMTPERSGQLLGTRAVRFDAAQSLTAAQMVQSRVNTGIYTSFFTSGAINADGTVQIDLATLPTGTYALQLLGSFEYTGTAQTATFTISLNESTNSTLATGTIGRGKILRLATEATFSLVATGATAATLTAYSTGADSLVQASGTLICTASSLMRITLTTASRTGGVAQLRGAVTFTRLS
jgi:hypothetical protein